MCLALHGSRGPGILGEILVLKLVNQLGTSCFALLPGMAVMVGAEGTSARSTDPGGGLEAALRARWPLGMTVRAP